MKALYITIDFLVVLFPALFSFHHKIKFYPYWKTYAIGSSIVAVFFILWDIMFTSQGVWSFNRDYILGIYFINLPIEEILFFFCIPFSCLFTFFCFEKFFHYSWSRKFQKSLCIVFAGLLVITGVLAYEKSYTSFTFISTAFVLLYTIFWNRSTWFGQFMLAYLVLLIPFFVVNGVLTGTGIDNEVVRYNPSGIIGVRVLTIPVEDFIYGFELQLLNVLVFKKLVRKMNISSIL